MQLLGNLRFVKDKILKCEDTKNMLLIQGALW